MDTYKIDDLGNKKGLSKKIASLVKENGSIQIEELGTVDSSNVDIICKTIQLMLKTTTTSARQQYSRRTREQDEAIVEYSRTHTLKETADFFCIATSTVTNIKRRLNQRTYIERTKEEDLAIVNYYMTHTLKETAKHFGVTTTIVNNLSTKYGMRKTSKNNKRKG